MIINWEFIWIRNQGASDASASTITEIWCAGRGEDQVGICKVVGSDAHKEVRRATQMQIDTARHAKLHDCFFVLSRSFPLACCRHGLLMSDHI